MPEFRDYYAEALAGGLDREVDLLTAPEEGPGGDRIVYRAIYRSMEVHGLPHELEVNGASIHHIQGPVRSQFTEIVQRGGFPLVFDKCMERGVEVGAGHWLSVVQVERSPLPDDLGAAIFECREQAQVAVAYVSSVLDERVAQELLAEDLIVLEGSKAVSSADMRELVRTFPPYEVRDREIETLAKLDGSAQPRHVKTAARWYLRGVQAGPSVDGVIFLWFAVEAIVGTSKKGPIEEALRRAGRDPADQGIGVGRLHGLRSKIVHDKPDSEPPPKEEVRQAFYDLEAMVRTLLRHVLSAQSTWPAHSASRVFNPPWAERISDAWASPVVEFHDQLPGVATEPIDGLTWGESLPALDVQATVSVVGGQGQDANRLRRIVEIALTYFGDPDIGEFPVAIKRFDDEAIQADCRSDCLDVNSRIVDPKNPIDAVRFLTQVHAFVGRCLLARLGVPSEAEGYFLHGVLTGWVWVHLPSSNQIPPESMTVFPLPANYSPFDLGEQLGAGIAGSEANLENARECLAGMSEEERAQASQIFEARVKELGGISSPAEFLDALVKLYS